MSRSLPGLAAALFVLSPALAHAQGAFSWGHHVNFDASNVTLVYGVPETDNVQFFGRCVAEGATPVVQAQIWADTGANANGTPVTLTVSGIGMAPVSMPGEITGVNADVGITGVAVRLGFDDPLFNLMTNQQSVNYHLDEGTPLSLSTDGFQEHLAGFLAACSAMTSAVAPPPEPTMPAPGAPALDLSCDRIGELRSLEGVTPQRVTFTNQADGVRGIVWIDYDGGFLDMGGLSPGESITIDTYLTHPFMITDGRGNCTEVMAPVAGEASFQITVPNAPAPLPNPAK
ncbi:VHL beta domain-containing protein [Nioella nitratireducens]|uniref:VHL beta domain-containing protein n=1 Tax=Nioella nitratireducens TaxID=1287720 RepID=UPI001313FBD6|nr:hypothetical protein [Nioella nitratireducens]